MPARARGASGKANVGMSNDNAGEKPAHRKAKVSCSNVNQGRVSRGLRRTRQGKPMHSGSIFPRRPCLGRADGAEKCARGDGIPR